MKTFKTMICDRPCWHTERVKSQLVCTLSPEEVCPYWEKERERLIQEEGKC